MIMYFLKESKFSLLKSLFKNSCSFAILVIPQKEQGSKTPKNFCLKISADGKL